jgi:hypothetical protein
MPRIRFDFGWFALDALAKVRAGSQITMGG